ncbi:MAG: O-antigen ligase family protein [Acidobacteria bacterium]|nr:O-antigen ligase family protein [Acidobacteriota bacterium]MBI3425548.1 O-antigen ligase family protein [Acidobacteriota bacterium]
MIRTVVIPLKAPSYHRKTAREWVLELLNQETVRVAALLLLHALLGLVLNLSPELATAHAGLTLLFGLWLAVYAPRLEQVAMIGAYITGAEVLWRMSKSMLPWEFGKYATIAIFFVALLRLGKLKGPIPAFVFFILLLPSIILPLANVSTDVLMDQLSFNLSGPLALLVSVWFFSHLKTTAQQLHRILLALICPIFSVAVIALKGIVTAKELVFINDSNFAMSGNYGPNQVSAILGLGALMALYWALDGKLTRWLKLLLLAVALYLTAQCVMTFSRTGLYLALGGAALVTLFLIQDRRLRMQVLGGLLAILLLAGFVLLPQLDKFTEGALTKRFSDTSGSGRSEIMQEDWRIFSENPLFGVGPGQAKYHLLGRYGSDGEHQVAAHNEFARLLAEHGMWGLAAILVLVYLGLLHFKQARTAKGRALNAALLFWCFGFLFSTAMRVVAPSFLFGLTALFILPEKSENHER